MTLDVAASVAADYAMVDGLQTVTYTEPSTGTVHSGVKGIRVGHRGMEHESGGMRAQATEMYWLLWAATLSVVPALGGKITDPDGTVWVIAPWPGGQKHEMACVGSTEIYYKVSVTQQR